MVTSVREFTIVNTEDEYIIGAEFSDGTTGKFFEWRRIDDSHIEVIHHCNRDRNGNFYTTRHVYEYKGVSPEYLRSRPYDEVEANKRHAEALCDAIAEGIKEIPNATYPYYIRNLARTAKHYRESPSFSYNPCAKAKMDELINQLDGMLSNQ